MHASAKATGSTVKYGMSFSRAFKQVMAEITPASSTTDSRKGHMRPVGGHMIVRNSARRFIRACARRVGTIPGTLVPS